jgi:ACS family hexuronate transporter-like MFS transporter
MINYMDRQTLANLSVRVTQALGLTEKQYGTVEFSFALGFAAGSLLFGFLADRLSVRWLYPAVLVGWSGAGILTGFAQNYEQLLICRIILGVFEAGHWPCALVTTQRLMNADDRSLGNSVLQSGAAIGAIVTPPLVLGIIRWADPQEPIRIAHQALGGGLALAATGPGPSVWQLPFLVIGCIGLLWVVAWFALVRRGNLDLTPAQSSVASDNRTSLWDAVWDRRFLVLFILVTALNTTWQLIRAWITKFLIQGRGYAESDALWFNSAYYIAADAGCLLAGAVTLGLARRGLDPHKARLSVYALCAGLTSLTFLAGTMPAGWGLLVLLLLIAAGSLGLFPCYYSFSQELSRTHMGRVSGILAAAGWVVSAPFQIWFGQLVDRTKSYDLGIMLAGLPPLIGLVALLLLWRKPR